MGRKLTTNLLGIIRVYSFRGITFLHVNIKQHLSIDFAC